MRPRQSLSLYITQHSSERSPSFSLSTHEVNDPISAITDSSTSATLTAPSTAELLTLTARINWVFNIWRIATQFVGISATNTSITAYPDGQTSSLRKNWTTEIEPAHASGASLLIRYPTPSQYPFLHLLSLFLNYQPSSHWKSQIIHLHIDHLVLESTLISISSASPVLYRFTPSFTRQLISVIITTLSIHRSFTLSLQAQYLPFQQILPTLIDFWHHLDCLRGSWDSDWTGLILLIGLFWVLSSFKFCVWFCVAD